MKKTALSLFALTIYFTLTLSAQEKSLTIEDASYRNRDLFPESIQNLAWQGERGTIAYIEKNALISFKASSSSRDTILSLDLLNKEYLTTGNDSLKRFPQIRWETEEIFSFTMENTLYTYHLEDNLLVEENSFPDDAGNLDIHHESKRAAFTIDNNLYLAVEGKQVQVTNDDEPNIINGQTVHRNEFGIDKGTFWSPDATMLAFYRKDQTMVSDYPLVDIDPRIATTDNIKYPMAGMTSEEVTLGVYHLFTGKTVFLKTDGPADQYLTSVTWGPESKFIYVAVLNRDQNHLVLNKYDVSSGELVHTLFEEKNDKYVEPEHPLYFLESDPHQFIWMSERDGYQHLYLYNAAGELIRQVTRGSWVVTEYLGTDKKAREVYFTATGSGPLNRDVYAANLKTAEVRQVAAANGTHNVIPGPGFKHFIDIFSDTVTTREYSVLSNRGKVLQTILQAENPLKDYRLGKMSIFKIPAGDGTDLYSRMILPPGFDPSQKYPAIVYVYGGPHAQLVRNTHMGGASLFLYYLAQEGNIVFTLDNRGSANRGRDFEQALFRNMGTIEVEDQMAGVDYLKNLNYVDNSRIGVHGWSYGGFMTISLMLKRPDQFSAGVCGGPVTDWKYYEVMYGERYMDTPETNPEGYENASLLNFADKLEGNLLIIHGTHDPVVVWQHSLKLIERFIKEQKLVDYFVYPGHGHGVGGRDRVHLNMKMADYFRKNL